MAEGLFRKLVEGRDDFKVSSAGVSAFAGDEANPNTLRILGMEGISLNNFRSRPVSDYLLDESTHVIAMTQGHLRSLESYFPAHSEKFYLVSEFAQNDQLRNRDVSDPFGGNMNDYAATKQMLQQLLPDLLAFIDQTFPKDSSQPS